MNRPTPEKQAELLRSREARAVREAQKLGELSLKFGRKLSGRQRPEFDGKLNFNDTADPNLVINLGKKLKQRKEPLFDRFSRHNHFSPYDEASIRRYAYASSSRLKVAPSDSGATAEAEEADDRQTLHIRDNIQGNLFDDRNIARLRWASLRSVQYSVRDNKPLDDQAMVHAADAITDFGYSLYDNAYILRGKAWEEFPEQIIQIGMSAKDNPEIFGKNPDLLRLVRIEQTKREEYWGERLEAVENVFGPHLTQQNIEDGASVDAEILRLTTKY